MQLLESLTAMPVPLECDNDGEFRVVGTRVRLDTVLTSFQRGQSAEEIVLKYPTVQLTDVYAIIAYYLWHRDLVDDYLEQRRQSAEFVEAENRRRFSAEGIRDRLLARRGAVS